MKTIKLKIEDLGSSGEGIAHGGGKTFFVPFVLPGEEVEAKVIKQNKNMVFAEAVQILKPSKNRIEPPCPYYKKCGGCEIQHMKYSDQLLFKQSMIKSTFKKVAGLDIKVLSCEKSENEFGYRNKISLPIQNKKLGLLEKSSHKIVEIDKCLIAKQFNENIIKILKKYIKLYETNNITHFVIRFLNNTLLLTIVSKTDDVSGLDYLKNEISKTFSNFGIDININKKENAEILSNNFKLVCGRSKIEDEFGGVKYNLSSGSFFQINDSVREKIYDYVQKLVSGQNIIDAYSGAGLLSCMIAKSAKKVFAVEIVKSASDNAKETANQNKLNNIEITCGDCKKLVPKICEKNKIDAVILDPPRAGCDKKVLEAIIGSNIKNIIYISCSPQTLARDVKILSAKYEIESIKPFDMFPQTHHVETVVNLKLKK